MEKLSSHQFMMLSAGVLMGTTFFPIAETVAGVAGRDGWISVLPGNSLAVPLGLMVFSLMKTYPGKNLLEISTKVLGKWFGKFTGFFYFLVSMYFGALLLAQAADTFKRSVLPVTPRFVFMGGVLILVIVIAWAGIEVMGRFTEIVFPLVTLGLLANLVLVVQRIEWEEFFPLFENGLKPIFVGIVKIAPYACEYILFLAGVLTFLHTDESQRRQMRAGIWRAALVVGVLNTLVVLIEILVFGPDETKRLNYGLLSLGKLVEIASTISGVESIFMLIWMGAMITKVGALYFMSMWGLQSVFGIEDKLKWYLILGLLFLGIGYRFNRGPELVAEIAFVDDYIIFPFTTIWIAILWGVVRWRKEISKIVSK